MKMTNTRRTTYEAAETGETNPDFHEGKSTESKCNKTVVDHITQIPVEYHIHTTIILEYK